MNEAKDLVERGGVREGGGVGPSQTLRCRQVLIIGDGEIGVDWWYLRKKKDVVMDNLCVVIS